MARARALTERRYDTLVIEASFVAIERTVEFRLLERGHVEPDDRPGTHPGVYREAARIGLFDESVADDLADKRRRDVVGAFSRWTVRGGSHLARRRRFYSGSPRPLGR